MQKFKSHDIDCLSEKKPKNYYSMSKSKIFKNTKIYVISETLSLVVFEKILKNMQSHSELSPFWGPANKVCNLFHENGKT